MKLLVIVILITNLLIGSILLPKGNYDNFSTITDLYTLFKTTNGNVSFLEFIEEQFLNIELIVGDDLEENSSDREAIPVSMKDHNISGSSLFFSPVRITLKTSSSGGIKRNISFFYTERPLNNYARFIFHPPQNNRL